MSHIHRLKKYFCLKQDYQRAILGTTVSGLPVRREREWGKRNRTCRTKSSMLVFARYHFPSSCVSLTWVNEFSLLIEAVRVRIKLDVKKLKNMQFLQMYGTRLAVLLVLLLLVLLHLSKRSPMISKYSKKNMPVIYEVMLGAWLSDVESCQGGNYLYNKK